mgnify:FL=1
MPTFASEGVVIEETKLVGQDGKHLRLKITRSTSSGQADQKSNSLLDGIGFNMGKRISEFEAGKLVDIVYTIDQNVWNGNKKLQLKVKDIRKKTQ